MVGASADQQFAARALVEGARVELRRVINRHLRTVRDDPTLEQMKESEAQVVRDALGVEKRLLDDLYSILTDDQRPRFAAFERAHRRSLLAYTTVQSLPVDVWQFLWANDVDPAQDVSLAALLENFDRESDGALVRKWRAMRAYFEDVKLLSDGSEKSRARSRKIQNEFLAANANLERTHASVVERLVAALPPRLGDALVTEVIERSLGDSYGSLASPEKYPVVREVLALDLTPDQRRKALAIIDEARTEALDQARTGVVEQARFVLLDDERRTDGRTSPLNLYLEQASALRVRVSGEMLSLLTPAQRLDYEASDVIEPSSSSVVKDE
ncbi:MAG: hypothetical protein SFY69_01745 [Planctomycetota bacterium]|nr:hypothetical protein [Planctomycetota bacterium]